MNWGRQNERMVNRRGSAVFLGWMIGSMVYMAVLASVGALYAQAISKRWTSALNGVVTIQVPEPDSPTLLGGKKTRLAAVLAVLRVTPGIRDVDLIKQDNGRTLLEPWLGKDLTADLELPTLIDLKFLASGINDLAALRARLNQAAPGTVAEDHRSWITRVAALTNAVNRGGWIIVLLVSTVALVSVIFAVLSGVSANRNIIGLLHLMGAGDSYVARQFQGHVLSATLPACIFGAAFATATIFAIASLSIDASPVDGSSATLEVVPALPFDIEDWGIVACVPIGFTILTMITARLAATIALRRIS